MAAHADVVVLGAGLQGVCTALALAAQGHRVTLVDGAAGCLQRAGLRSEGKIHLGFVYANDPTRRTAARMLDGALSFAPLVERFVGHPVDWPAVCSEPFVYGVLDDTMVPPATLWDHYQQIDDEHAGRGRPPYLGRPVARLWWPAGAPEAHGLNPARVAAAAVTEEVAVDIAKLRPVLVAALQANASITQLYGHRVRAAEPTAGGFRLEGERRDASRWQLDAALVVNCLWGGRIALDTTLGLHPRRPWIHRLKYRVLGTAAPPATGFTSVTFVLGPYGDVVVHPGRATYLSWYPAGMRGHSLEASPPASWDGPCAGAADEVTAGEVARATVDGLAELVPGLVGFRPHTVDAGVIVAWGATDIDDPASELHERHEIGVHAHGSWYSVDPGKLTMAPYFAAQVAALVGPAR